MSTFLVVKTDLLEKVYNFTLNIFCLSKPGTPVLIYFQLCIRSMAQVDCIGPMKIGMKIRRDSIALAAEVNISTPVLIYFQLCIRSMAQVDCIGPMKIGMKIRRDSIS